MKKRLKYGIVLVVVRQLMLIAAVLVLPPLTRILPGVMRVRLARIPVGAALLDLGTTPMPTALPAPANVSINARITIPPLVVPALTPTISATAVYVVLTLVQMIILSSHLHSQNCWHVCGQLCAALHYKWELS